MPFGGTRKIRRGDSCVRVTYAITCTCDGEIVTKEVAIGNLAIVKLKWTAEINDDKLNIEFSFSSCKNKSAMGCTIKINVGSDELNYFMQNFDTTAKWSDWEPMGNKESQSTIGLHVFSCDFYFSAFEVKLDKLVLKLHTDTDFTDFQLATTEGTVAVHKSCLAANSEVFKNMLMGEWKETAEGKININGVSLQTLQHLKDYMYLGTIPGEGTSQVCPLLLIARCYLIEDLQKHCIRKLAETVLAEDLYSLIEFACENNIPELAYAILQKTQDGVINDANGVKKTAADLK